jgi:chromosome segregation ATPase
MINLNREVEIKNQQSLDYEKKLEKIRDEHDLSIYKLHEQSKDYTEMKLKAEMLISTNTGLVSEKTHLMTELREVRDLYKSWEMKCSETMKELKDTTFKYQEVKRNNIMYDQNILQKDEKIKDITDELDELKDKFHDLNLDFNTLKI